MGEELKELQDAVIAAAITTIEHFDGGAQPHLADLATDLQRQSQAVKRLQCGATRERLAALSDTWQATSIEVLDRCDGGEDMPYWRDWFRAHGIGWRLDSEDADHFEVIVESLVGRHVLSGGTLREAIRRAGLFCESALAMGYAFLPPAPPPEKNSAGLTELLPAIALEAELGRISRGGPYIVDGRRSWTPG